LLWASPRGAGWSKAADEYGTQQNALAWAEDRPVLAVCLVLVAWVVVVFAIASVYAFLV